MRRSLNRKRALLHDTLNSNLKNAYDVAGFETKESEQYTIDILKKAEEKDIDVQMKFLEEIEKKKNEEEKSSQKKLSIKAKLRKRLQSAKPFHFKLRDKAERWYSAMMKDKETTRAKNNKKSTIQIDKLIGFNTMVSQANWLNKMAGYNLNHRKFVNQSTARTMNTDQEL